MKRADGALRVSRRALLAGGAMTVATASVMGGMAPLPRGREAQAIASATVVLHDPRVPLPAHVGDRLAQGGAQHLPLQSDPVRQWRDDAGRLLARRETRLLGVTLWPTFLLVRGLAEESGRRVRYQRLDATTGAVVWLVA